MDAAARPTVLPPHPPPHYSASEGIGGARGLGNLVRTTAVQSTSSMPKGELWGSESERTQTSKNEPFGGVKANEPKLIIIVITLIIHSLIAPLSTLIRAL